MAIGEPWNAYDDINPFPSFYNGLKFVFQAVFPLLAPAAIVYVKTRADGEKRAILQEAAEARHQLENEFKRQLKDLSELSQKSELANVHTEQLSNLLNDGNVKEQETLKQLQVFEYGIKQVLDFRCSHFHPSKKRDRRLKLQNYLLKQSFHDSVFDLNMYDGLQNIFAHDHKFCGGGFHQNGQLWRSWMEVWKIKAALRKYKDAVEKLS